MEFPISEMFSRSTPDDLAARETGVEVAGKEIGEVHPGRQAFDILRFAAVADAHHVARLEAVNGGGALVGHADTQPGAFIDRHVGDVPALEIDRARHDLILWIPHDGHQQRGLPRTIRPEEDMDLAGFYFQVDVLEDLFFSQPDLQAFNLEHALLPPSHVILTRIVEHTVSILGCFDAEIKLEPRVKRIFPVAENP